jgi:CRP/FNR family nitrogen fixation transcriptional regulator
LAKLAWFKRLEAHAAELYAARRADCQRRSGVDCCSCAPASPGGRSLELPMSRQDIADYLELTIETVSRTMTQLVSEQAIGLPSSRRIVLRNSSALRQLNS